MNIRQELTVRQTKTSAHERHRFKELHYERQMDTLQETSQTSDTVYSCKKFTTQDTSSMQRPSFYFFSPSLSIQTEENQVSPFKPKRTLTYFLPKLAHRFLQGNPICFVAILFSLLSLEQLIQQFSSFNPFPDRTVPRIFLD